MIDRQTPQIVHIEDFNDAYYSISSVCDLYADVAIAARDRETCS